jgi:hypothetical protein
MIGTVMEAWKKGRTAQAALAGAGGSAAIYCQLLRVVFKQRSLLNSQAAYRASILGCPCCLSGRDLYSKNIAQYISHECILATDCN